MMRPPMRKASEASFSALIWPVSTTVSPTPPFAAVIVRTGRASTVLAFLLLAAGDQQRDRRQ